MACDSSSRVEEKGIPDDLVVLATLESKEMKHDLHVWLRKSRVFGVGEDPIKRVHTGPTAALQMFSPEAFSVQFTKGLFGWAAQVLLIWLSLKALGSGDASILDIASYGGYAFVGVSISILARILWSYAYYLVMPWTSLCMAVFLVKTMKRILFAEARSYNRDSSKHHYLLLFMAVAQFPIAIWLGYTKTS